MPTSNLYNAPLICQLVRQTGAKKILDVGPGHGKYGVLLREYAGAQVVDAVEMWSPYVKEFKLGGIYDEVFIGDALEMSEEPVDSGRRILPSLNDYDLVLSVSSIEHMPKEPATEWLRRIRGMALIVTPMQWMQEDHQVPTERHQSLWTIEDFRTRFPKRFQLDASQRGAVIALLGPKP
ncbi:MAG: class I SAM-dependent methyltransferase [Actinomycetia bacterium]|nr:class I SAM-dependent methyltransferase [Actinomycetes bacterium]